MARPRDPNDLTQGYKDVAALGTADPSGHTVWDDILGDPDEYVAPLDPLRELAVVKGLGSRGIAASICPAQITDTTKADYGDRPAVAALLERIKPHLE